MPHFFGGVFYLDKRAVKLIFYTKKHQILKIVPLLVSEKLKENLDCCFSKVEFCFWGRSK